MKSFRMGIITAIWGILVLSFSLSPSSYAEIQKVQLYLLEPLSNELKQHVDSILVPWVDKGSISYYRMEPSEDTNYMEVSVVDIAPKANRWLDLYDITKKINDTRYKGDLNSRGKHLWKVEVVATGEIFPYRYLRRSHRDIYPREHYGLKISGSSQVFMLIESPELAQLAKSTKDGKNNVLIRGDITNIESHYAQVAVKEFKVMEEVALQPTQSVKAVKRVSQDKANKAKKAKKEPRQYRKVLGAGASSDKRAKVKDSMECCTSAQQSRYLAKRNDQARK